MPSGANGTIFWGGRHGSPISLSVLHQALRRRLHPAMPAWLPMPPTSRAIPKSRSSISEQSLENLCRYMLRPPLAVERLERLASGRLAYRMKTPWRNGTTHVIMSDGELVEKLAGLVPAPRFQLVRYFGILASAAKQRPSIVPVPPPASRVQSCETLQKR